MRVRVLAFAALRDRLGFSEREVEIADGATAAQTAAQLLGGPAPRGVAFAVNQEYAAADTVLREGDELALLPPVSGGAPSCRVQAEPIDLAGLIAEVSHPSCGAVLSFLGTARELDGETLEQLEYEAYEPMATRFLERLAGEIAERFGVERVAIVHRVGPIKLAEVSVAIVLASPHRAEGFAALRHAIERIKEAAPVWKKEVTRRGGRWIAVEKMEGG